MADQNTQGVHPFTVAWWERLPTPFRRADRVQGYRISDAWHGLNRDPRFVTGWDGWHRTNTSTEAWKASVEFTRTFRATPNQVLHIRTWHHPVVVDTNSNRVPNESGVRIQHTVKNQAATVIAHTSTPATPTPGDGYVEHHTTVTPDRFGIVHVTIRVSLDVPNARNFMDAVHVGHQDATFPELPALDYFTTAAAYPLLRFMDGIGHQAGYISDYVNAMHSGEHTDPVHAPEAAIPFLAAVLGVPRRYSQHLTVGQLREHLVDLVEGNYPTPGSRQHIAITAQQWLTGDKDVAVIPAREEPTYITPTEQALANAMGRGSTLRRMRVTPTAPPSGVSHANDVWVKTTAPTGAYIRSGSSWVLYTATNVSSQVAAVVADHADGDKNRQCTLIVYAKATEVPQNDLAAFTQFLNDSGVIPAGHRVITRERYPTWNQWEAASGTTWNSQAQVITTWNDSDSAGVENA